MPLSNEFLEEYMEILAEDEGTRGRKVALEGGGGTRGYGITTIPDELKEYAKTASDEDLARKLVGWHYDKVVGKIGQSTWDNMPNSMKIITVDQHYNSGTLYNGFKTDIINGDYAGALKNTLDIISANDPQTGGKGVMNGLVGRRVRNYNRAAVELGLSVINQYNIGSTETGTQVAYNYNDGSNFNVNTKSGIHSASASGDFSVDAPLKKNQITTDDTEDTNLFDTITDVAGTVADNVTDLAGDAYDTVSDFAGDVVDTVSGVLSTSDTTPDGGVDTSRLDNELKREALTLGTEPIVEPIEEGGAITTEDFPTITPMQENPYIDPSVMVAPKEKVEPVVLTPKDATENKYKNSSLEEILGDIDSLKDKVSTIEDTQNSPMVFSQPHWGRSKVQPILSDKQLEKIEADADALKEQLAATTDFFGITNKSVIGAGAEHLWVGKAIFDAANKQEFQPDPDFVLKELDVELLQSIQKEYGINDLEPLGEAVSLAHMHSIALQIQEEEALLKTIMAEGTVPGIIAMLGVSVFDPVALGVTVATEGAAAPYIYGAKVTRLGRMLRAATLTGTTNAALEAMLVSQNETMDVEDIYYAAILGAGLGGFFASLRKGGKTVTPGGTDEAYLKALDDLDKEVTKDIVAEEGLNLTAKGQKTFNTDANAQVKAQMDLFDDEPVDTFQGTIRSDGHTEHKVRDGEEYIVVKNEDGSNEVRKCK
tara:strand:- start:1302 stop:3431 length:2130 start_codon:yes stop_codon:yes gene_type:complete